MPIQKSLYQIGILFDVIDLIYYERIIDKFTSKTENGLIVLKVL